MICGEFLLKADLTPLIINKKNFKKGVLAHSLGEMSLKSL